MTDWKELARKHEDSANHYARRCYELEAEKKVLREGIIHALQIPIGAVLDQHTRFALVDALKEVDDETE